MITTKEKNCMTKCHCNLQAAKKILREEAISLMVEKYNISIEEATSKWDEKNSRSGKNAEKEIIRTFNEWNLKKSGAITYRRIPRSGKDKKTKRPRKEKLKPADIKMAIDGKEIFLESKMRMSPHALYDDIIKNPTKCYKIHYKDKENNENYYYVLHEDKFRSLVIDKIKPEIEETDRRVKFYHDLFTETEDKTKFIDMVILKQRMYKYVFFIRTHTYEYLVKRCGI